jgi:hypothetical protein
MQRKTSDRQHLPADASRDKHLNFESPGVNNVRTGNSSMQDHSMGGADQLKESRNNFAPENGQQIQGQDAGLSGERENERLKTFKKNRRKGWSDML